MPIDQVLVTACRQSQRSVCFVKQFATMCVIRGDCYNVCCTGTLLQCVSYVNFATVCVIHGLCYNVCYTWTLLHYVSCVNFAVLYMDFATLCVIRGLCYSVCCMWTFKISLLQYVSYVSYVNINLLKPCVLLSVPVSELFILGFPINSTHVYGKTL